LPHRWEYLSVGSAATTGPGGGSGVRSTSDSTAVDPAAVAEEVFRDLVCRASFGNLPSVLKPVLA